MAGLREAESDTERLTRSVLRIGRISLPIRGFKGGQMERTTSHAFVSAGMPGAAPICDHCPEPAAVILPGSEPETLLGIRLTAGTPAQCLCLQCARQRGWPWLKSEKRPENA